MGWCNYMTDRARRIYKLKTDRKARESYINAKVSTLVPSQIKSLRLKSSTPKQTALAKAAGTYQSRLSDLERPGEANMTLETLAWIASVHKVGLVVKFVPFSEMLAWENGFSQDSFTVTPLDQDFAFLQPGQDASLFFAQADSMQEQSIVNMANHTMKIKSEIPRAISYQPVRLSKVSWKTV